MPRSLHGAGNIRRSLWRGHLLKTSHERNSEVGRSSGPGSERKDEFFPFLPEGIRIHERKWGGRVKKLQRMFWDGCYLGTWSGLRVPWIPLWTWHKGKSLRVLFYRAKITWSHFKFSFFIGKWLCQLASESNGEEALGCPAFLSQGPSPRPAGLEEPPPSGEGTRLLPADLGNC